MINNEDITIILKLNEDKSEYMYVILKKKNLSKNDKYNNVEYLVIGIKKKFRSTQTLYIISFYLS